MRDERQAGENLKVLKAEPMFRTGPEIKAGKPVALPGPDDPYQAAGTGDTHEQPVLVLLMAAPPYHGFEYVHIQNVVWDVTPDGGEVIRFIYTGFEPKRGALYGDDLLWMWHQILLRKVAWVRVAPRDFRPAGAASREPVITRIVVADWVRPKPQAQEVAKALEALELEELEDA